LLSEIKEQIIFRRYFDLCWLPPLLNFCCVGVVSSKILRVVAVCCSEPSLRIWNINVGTGIYLVEDVDTHRLELCRRPTRRRPCCLLFFQFQTHSFFIFAPAFGTMHQLMQSKRTAELLLRNNNANGIIILIQHHPSPLYGNISSNSCRLRTPSQPHKLAKHFTTNNALTQLDITPTKSKCLILLGYIIRSPDEYAQYLPWALNCIQFSSLRHLQYLPSFYI